MSKLWLIGLAASAAWTPAAVAQTAPPPMAHGAHAPGGPMAHPRMPRPMRPGHVRPGPMNPGHMKGVKHWQRFGRGHIVPPHFRSPQFFVHNWHSFGWPAPMPGGQWIRYYDDALLIDRAGRVMDSRYGWDWDRRGGRGRYDDRYEDDYGYEDEHYGRGEDYGYDDYDDGRGHRGRGPVVRHMPPHPGYGYGAGCGCGPVVITETTTTTAPVVETRTYYETVYERRAAPRRHYSKPVVRYSKPVVRYSKPVRRSVKPAYRPAPRPGERG